MAFRPFLVGLLAALFYLGSMMPIASAAHTAPKGRTIHVLIRNYAFVPRTVHVTVGDSIVWTNKDADLHTVTSDAPTSVRLASNQLSHGKTYRLTVTHAGAFKYHCAFHAFMSGTVVVSRRHS